MKNRKTNMWLAALAFVLVLGAGAGKAAAYFTSYATTDGTYPVTIKETTKITETFSNWTKHLRITADETSGPVYVRARAFHSDAYGVEYSDPAEKWEYRSDGFYYYKDILYAGEQTEELTVKITGVPEDIEDPLAFGVAVIYEATPVRYRADGTPYADWSVTVAGKEASDD